MFLSAALPLLSAFIFVAGVLWLKRASELGADFWRVTCVTNWVTALVFLPLLAFGGQPLRLELLWQPALVGLVFLVGQILAFLALRIGDVSIATPVLGLKIIFVAVLTTVLIGERVTANLWISAGLASGAIALLNLSDRRPGGTVGRTVLASAGAAVAYASFDVLVQKWAPAFGSGRFLPLMMGFGALYSAPLWALRKRGGGLPATARFPLFAGAAATGVQSMLFISTIAFFGRATAANVLYSSRGLWSIAAVWFVGHWFNNRERMLGVRVLRWRIAGAVLLLGAIVLVLVA